MIALRRAGVPLTGVYFVSPRSIAAWAAAFMFPGVSKSGSPTVRSTMSRPAAFNSLARAAAAVLGETLMRDTREAGTKLLMGGLFISMWFAAPERYRRT